MPYQYSRDMRGEKTLQFYKNLNLEACIWEFENWFHMSELQQACGGEITTDGQVHASTNQKSKTQLKQNPAQTISTQPTPSNPHRQISAHEPYFWKTHPDHFQDFLMDEFSRNSTRLDRLVALAPIFSKTSLKFEKMDEFFRICQ